MLNQTWISVFNWTLCSFLFLVKNPPGSICDDCFKIPCQLAAYPNCILAWQYNVAFPDVVSFTLQVDTPADAKWIGIAFNAANSPADLLMVTKLDLNCSIKFAGFNLFCFN